MQKININSVAEFEQISSFQTGKIVGGFSRSFSVSGTVANDLVGNNCHGGNCAHGCGGDNNVYCNTTVGCGPKTGTN